MPEEIPTTPTAAEPAPAAVAAQAVTAPAAEPEKPNPEAELAWKAYKGLQTTVNRLHTRVEDVLGQNRSLADALGAVREDQDAILKQTVGEDEFKARVVARAQAQERQAALQAADAGQRFIVAQTGLFLDTLKAAGVDPNDPTIDWARDAGNVEEWRARVGPSVVARIQQANTERIRRHEAELSAKTKKEVEAEAQALTEQQLKAAGVDRIDTAKGSARTSFVDRIRDPEYRNSPQFLKDLADAKAGRLKT